MDELLLQPTLACALVYRFFSLVCDTLTVRVLCYDALILLGLVVFSHIEALSYKERFGLGFSPIKGFPRVKYLYLL